MALVSGEHLGERILLRMCRSFFLCVHKMITMEPLTQTINPKLNTYEWKKMPVTSVKINFSQNYHPS